MTNEKNLSMFDNIKSNIIHFFIKIFLNYLIKDNFYLFSIEKVIMDKANIKISTFNTHNIKNMMIIYLILKGFPVNTFFIIFIFNDFFYFFIIFNYRMESTNVIEDINNINEIVEKFNKFNNIKEVINTET